MVVGPTAPYFLVSGMDLGRDAGAAVPAGLGQLADQLDVDVEDLSGSCWRNRRTT